MKIQFKQLFNLDICGYVHTNLSIFTGVPISIIFIVSGAIAIASSQNKQLAMASLVFSIISAISAIVLVAHSAILCYSHTNLLCKHNGDCLANQLHIAQVFLGCVVLLVRYTSSLFHL